MDPSNTSSSAEDLRRLIPQDRTLRTRAFAELLRNMLRGGR